MTMSDNGRSLLGAAKALRTALEQTGDALAAPRLAALLESEAGLAAALAVLPHGDEQLGGTRDQILHELARARQELTRCQRLGTSLTASVAQALGDCIPVSDYRANGRTAEPAPVGAVRLETRG